MGKLKTILLGVASPLLVVSKKSSQLIWWIVISFSMEIKVKWDADK